MITRKTSMRRLVAGVGAIALALIGAAGVASAAHAVTPSDNPPPAQAPADATGQLTVHKRAGAQTDAGNGTVLENPPGTPLGGVEFTLQQIGTDPGTGCVALDLRTAAGWDKAQEIVAGTATGCDVGAAVTETTDQTTGEALFDGLALGLYYVTETDAPADVVERAVPFYVTVPYPSATSSSTTWLYDVHVYPKNAVADAPTKTIQGEQLDLVLGADVTWTIAQQIPTLTGTDSTFTEASVSDTLDPRLALASSTVQIRDGDTVLETLTGAFPAAGATGALTWTLDEPSRSLLKTHAGKSLVVTVVTTVTSVTADGAAPGAITNTGTVSFNNKPQDTPEEPYTYWGSLKVTKHDAANTSQALAGAKFEVFDNAAADGSCAATKPGASTALASGTSLNTGVVEWTRADQATPTVTELGLWIANSATPLPAPSKVYCLYETQAPAGYTMGTPNPQAVTISTANTNALTTTPVANTKVRGVDLPLTGSTGTALFVGGGIALVLVAGGAALIAARRKQGTLK